MAASSPRRILVQKIQARVFGQLYQNGGGNPVTIFSSSEPLSLATRSRLAQSCSWESVMVDAPEKSGRRPILDFYMPTGQAVSFCAHAALGVAYHLSRRRTAAGAATLDDAMKLPEKEDEAPQNEMIHFCTTAADDHDEKGSLPKVWTAERLLKKGRDDLMALHMQTEWTEERVRHPPTLYRGLRQFLGLTPTELHQEHLEKQPAWVKLPALPTLCNASVARPKTLIYVNSLDALQAVSMRTFPEQAEKFRRACEAIDSTGLYLYTLRPSRPEKEEAEPAGKDDQVGQDQDADDDDDDDNEGEEWSSAWECRQFPRASGYVEDPATGIAAAALAVSLRARGIRTPTFEFHQGTAMQRPSLLWVDQLHIQPKRDDDDDDNAADDDDLHKDSPHHQDLSSRNLSGQPRPVRNQNDDEDEEELEKKEPNERPPWMAQAFSSPAQVSFRLRGRVEIDQEEELHIEEEEERTA